MKSVDIRDDVAQKIARLAAKRQMKPEVLINKVLDTYVTNQTLAHEQSGTAFLLSVAGMFDSGPNDTSERVRAVVADAIVQKHHGSMHENPDR